MRTFPKWPIFVVLFSILISVVGMLSDGVLAPTSNTTTQINGLLDGDPVTKFSSLANIISWHYPWATGNWLYFTMFLTGLQCVFGLLILIEGAMLLRELARVL